MKKYMILMMTGALLASILAGCRSNVPQDTTGSIAPGTTTAPTTTQPSGTTVPTTGGSTNTESETTQILSVIWGLYGENERFACYGGSVQGAVNDAPGPLDMTNTEELTAAYLIPQEQLSSIREGASLVHMMNSNIFTCAAVRIAEGGDRKALYEAWRDTIQNNRWICGQPDRVLMATVGEEYLVMAFGSTDAMKLFADKLPAAHAQAQILYNEAVVS